MHRPNYKGVVMAAALLADYMRSSFGGVGEGMRAAVSHPTSPAPLPILRGPRYLPGARRPNQRKVRARRRAIRSHGGRGNTVRAKLGRAA